MTSDKSNISVKPFYCSISGDTEEDKKLLEPITYILQVPGKEIRTELIKAFNYWLQIPDEKLQIIIEIIRLLHTTSIVLDDVQDNAVLRRGVPVAHSIYGIGHTVNAADYMLFIVLEKLMSMGHAETMIRIYTEQLLILHRGQGAEIYWRDNFICPTEMEYKIMTKRKCGGLFHLAVRLMQVFSKCKENFEPLIETLGLYFQIRDDYCNLCVQEYSDKKGYCEDLTEGKFSFPIIHAVQNHPDDTQLLNLLKQRPTDNETKRQCVNLLDNLGSFNYTRKTLEDLYNKAKIEITLLGGNTLLMAVMDKLFKNIKDYNKPKEALMISPNNT